MNALSQSCDTVDLRGAAALLGRSYSWLQRSWRGLDAFPAPYVGGGPGGRPRWSVLALKAWRDGVRPANPASPRLIAAVGVAARPRARIASATPGSSSVRCGAGDRSGIW